MRILPVLDLLGGEVVRGIGGRRHDYRPIVSRLTRSTNALDVAQAIRRHFGLSSLYLADLDAIAGTPPAWTVYDQLHDAGFRLCVDAGLQDSDSAANLAARGVEEIVFGLETLRDPEELRRACERFGSGVVFSLDLRDGEPLGNRPAWHNGDAASILEQAVAAGARRLIALDLARVGSGAGIGTETLCERVIHSFPDVELIAGGGVCGIEDLRRLHALGVDGVLMASALHDGGIQREQLAEFGTL
jgi:phosphoribosylformimino-5-aminoimidazole carboxamide ribotide isomerase